jgi:1-acyl-sn-glycerol-3-phosphate acyltransferase
VELVAARPRPGGVSGGARRPLPQRLSRRLLVAVLRCLVRLEVAGLEHLPRDGPFVLAANHLHALDPAIGLLLVPRRVTGVAKDKWSRPPFGWLLEAMGDVVYVGERRRGAMRRLVEVLRSGGVVAILPEGTRSPTHALGRGQPGVALLAARAPAPVVPAAAYGQERAAACWTRLRRAPVRVRIGPPIVLPTGAHDRQRLQELSDEVMRAIAAMLPPEYRGVYGDA